ncbi:MAG: hypothetical protein IJ123_06135 [Blautia sp.]|nr:hypothetical protein [Blautia sp.]
MKKGFCRMISAVLAIVLSLALPGCGRAPHEENRSSLGVDNEIAGFLFNFDQRDETALLVKQRNRGQYPVRVSWAFGENLKVDEKAPEYTSTEEEFIHDVYYALSNTIIMGNAYDHSEETPFYIELELQSGDICRYDFVSLNTIRLSEQNYVIESDGNLWQAIRKASKKASDKASDEASDEASNEVSNETSDESSNEASDEASDESSNEASDKDSNEASDKSSNEVSDEASNKASDEASNKASDRS